MQPRSGIYNGNCGCKLMLNLNFNAENWFYRFFFNGHKRTLLRLGIKNMDRIHFPHHSKPFITKCSFIFPFIVYNIQMPKQCKGKIYC